jgi:hypothetical protein
VLIPVRYLVNGTTIRQEAVRQVTYHHVELSTHDVLFAEGLPAESYLDVDGHCSFDNGDGVTILYPDFASRMWEAEGCAPLAVTGTEFAAVKSLANKRAADARFRLTHEHALSA